MFLFRNREEKGLAPVSRGPQALRGPAEAQPKNQESLELEEIGGTTTTTTADDCTLRRDVIGKVRGGATKSRYSRATLKILSSMPSRNIGENAVACISLRAKHSAQRCRVHTSPGPPPCWDAEQGVCSGAEEGENIRTQLVSDLRRLPAGQCLGALKASPLNLAQKILLRKLARDDGWPVGRDPPHRGVLWVFAVWLKLLGGRFGSPVLSYFLFLRTLLFFNVLLVLVVGLLLVLPQTLEPPPHNASLHTHGALHLLTGGGYVAHSVMFYGYYGNTDSSSAMQDILDRPISSSSNGGGPQTEAPASYNIPLAYFFTITTGLFLTGIILVCSFSWSLGRSFRVLPSRGKMALNVFCCWDFRVTKEESVQRQSEDISARLKLWLRLLAWVLCLAAVFLSGFATYCLADHLHTVGATNLLLPGLFQLVLRAERYESPFVATYVSIFRNLLLKVGLLGTLCYHWLWRIASEPQRYGLQCWESFVGQELYRLLLMDFFCTLIYTCTWELGWRLISSRVLKRGRRPVFDVSRHVLELIYGQTLTWLGVFFAPLLPAVQLLKLILLFYIRKSSVMLNCEAPGTPWRARHMTTVFSALLCFPSFVGAVTCVTYAVWTLAPSPACGPFPNAVTAAAGRSRHRGAGVVFLIVTYVHAQMCAGQRRIISLLERQIVNQGVEKKFLISKLQALYEDEKEDLGGGPRG
ncbi:hypothetical protein NHX12_032312 [Muraenolepis orangiensis]|uniref:Transmembrane channel-like protein n=1 Tax=Muraenolepis orangiensis TaxID=630683 RepID=A0A9Q0E6X2_9TELE|nr:hypothetical protein NHX12_032312 [Muraenolepis orangiensis]